MPSINQSIRRFSFVSLLYLLYFTPPAIADDSDWTQLNHDGKAAFNAGDLKTAEQKFTAAVKITETFGEKDERLGASLNNLAEVEVDEGKLDAAEPLYRRAVSVYEQAFGPDHARVAVPVNNLGKLLRKLKKYDEAEKLFQRAIAITEKSYGPKDIHVAMSLNSLAGMDEDRQQYDQAEALYLRSLEIVKASVKGDDTRLGTALNNLGYLCFLKNDFVKAEPLLKDAVGVSEKANGPDHPTTAIYLFNYASVLKATGRTAEADKLFDRAVEIRKKKSN